MQIQQEGEMMWHFWHDQQAVLVEAVTVDKVVAQPMAPINRNQKILI